MVQLEFPCAQLLARPLRSGTSLDDCDPSTVPAPTTPATQAAAPPYNWTSFKVAAYADSSGSGGTGRRLVVSTSPPPPRRTKTLRSDEVVGHNTRGYTVDNYRWSVEPASYYATDLTAVRDGRDVDAASFDVYRVKADEPPLMLTQVPRPARTSMLLRIDDAEPSVDTSPSTPVAVLQAPPTVRGLGQQRDFTPEFATSAATGQSATEGKSTKLGAHVEASVVGTAGAGFLGNNVRAGGGVSVGFQFMNEVEKSLTRAVEVATTEGYGGSFAHHTLVTRAIKEYMPQRHRRLRPRRVRHRSALHLPPAGGGGHPGGAPDPAGQGAPAPLRRRWVVHGIPESHDEQLPGR